MKVVTMDQMREIDRRAIKDFGIPGLLLMERAGTAVAEKACEMLSQASSPVVVVVSGKGNNGGDGFVAARVLRKSGVEVKVFLAGRKRELRGDARINYNILSRLTKIIELPGSGALKVFRAELASCDLVIDAIVGTGAKDKMKGVTANAISAVSECNKPVISVDIPSGLDADRGFPLGVCVKASHTVTLGLPKIGLLTYPGADFAGRVTTADIGLPPKVLEDKKVSVNMLEGSDIKLPERPGDAHKGSMGHVFVLAGSPGYTGAATLVSFASLRSGCGLVTLGAPRGLNAVLETKLTEVITRPLPETEGGTLGLGAESEILDIVERSDCLAVGPGLGKHPETQALIRKLLMVVRKPVVIDADGLNVLEGELGTLGRRQGPTVITPHPGEMGRLLGIPASQVQAKRIEICREIAVKNRVVTVLKGAGTIISAPDGSVFINVTGNSGMATAGAGDVLVGVISGLIARGMDPVEGAKAGVFIHGLAGDIASRDKGRESLIAGDILEYLPKAFLSLC